MKCATIIAWAVLLFGTSAYAQTNEELLVDTLPDANDMAPTVSIVQGLDSMTNCLFEGCFAFNDSMLDALFGADTLLHVAISDSEIIDKMQYIPTSIPIELNSYVRPYIDLYGMKRREQVRQMIGLGELYFPIFEAELDRRNLPMELKYLPIVESALNPHAVSRVGATGLWQIMYSTGKWLDLEIHSYIDERRDPYRSTVAALDYLERMYAVYGDWLLVIAAYNCGPGNVNKAIRRSGGGKTFWEIRNYLPRETRGYVPAFIGAMYVFHYYEDFNLKPIPTAFSFNNTDTVMVHEPIELERVANIIGADVNELAYLNPSLKKREVPKVRDGYALVLPIDKVYAYEDMRDSIYRRYRELELVNISDTVISNDVLTSIERLDYTIKSGDNLGEISGWYDVEIEKLRKWSGLTSNTIHVGDTLRVYVDVEDAEKYRKIETWSDEQKKKHTASVATVTHSGYSSGGSGSTKLTYTIKSGDNLGYIAEWYDCSAQQIRNWNGISGNTIRVGAKLAIYVPTSQVGRYENINSMSFSAKQNIEKGGGSAKVSTPVAEEDCNCVYYTVRSGDTLWDIAKKYPGVSIDDIKRDNKIYDSRGLKPGMKLKIKI